ncbi:MAG TPA: acyl-CoA carboxylase subunit epsilon [Pseudonocardiaceae bacterium]|nr:acyl-CoA carboxylase subunit epsilon [Pseudonocardiaceae bacterium]
MTADERPLLRVVRGEPDDAELVALTAVVLGLASAPRAEPAPPQRSAWADHASAMRRTLPHGPGAWRASGLPR